MTTIELISDRSSGVTSPGKAYFETTTNMLIIYNGTNWLEFHSLPA